MECASIVDCTKTYCCRVQIADRNMVVFNFAMADDTNHRDAIKMAADLVR